MQNTTVNVAQQLATVLRMSSGWYWQQDRNFRFLDVSAGIQLTGKQATFFVGKTRWELPNLMPPEFWAEHQSVLASHKPFYQLEYKIASLTGEATEPRWISISGDPLFSDDGEFVGYHGFAHEITERKSEHIARLASERRSELLLRERNQRFMAIFEQSPVGMIEWDKDFRVIEWNATAERIFGWSRADMLGQPATRLTAPELHAELHTTLQQALAGQAPSKNLGKNLHKIGRTVLCSWTNALLHDDSGQALGVVSMVEDLTEQTLAARRMEHVARHDALTGLPNRAYLLQLLESALTRSAHTGQPSAVMMLNMDRFKIINDSLGHAAGDQVLSSAAQRLRNTVGPDNAVARVGGDEFAVLVTQDASTAATRTLAEKIHAAMRLPYQFETQELECTPSIGVALFPDDGETALTLLQSADAAMTYAKSQGRDNLQFFNTSLKQAAEERKTLGLDLRNAVKRKELLLHFQPQVDAITGAMTGAEALVRWQHPTRGLISPVHFITIAEETGLIEDIGSWVLDEACRTLREWRTGGVHGVCMSVNLSALQLKNAALISEITDILQRYGLNGTDLELELTESVAMADPHATIGMLQRLRKLGVQLAIDDFGTGYSSLSYLKLLPLQRLKVDRAFVKEIESNANDAAICSATIALAHKLKLHVVAEGVETQRQRAYLLRDGCETLQGYLFSRPVPSDEAMRYALAHTLP